MTLQRSTFTSPIDGLELAGYAWDVTEPRGVVQVAHGLACGDPVGLHGWELKMPPVPDHDHPLPVLWHAVLHRPQQPVLDNVVHGL